MAIENRKNRMTHVSALAWKSLLTALVSGLPLCVNTTAAPLEQIAGGSDLDCCLRLQGTRSGSFHCPGIVDQRCPHILRTISRNELRHMVLTVRNPAGQLGRGRNGFCIEITQATTGESTPMSRMRMDVTMRIGRAEAARAVSEIAPTGIGLYCARVVLGIPGTWKIGFQCASSAGSGRISFLENV